MKEGEKMREAEKEFENKETEGKKMEEIEGEERQMDKK